MDETPERLALLRDVAKAEDAIRRGDVRSYDDVSALMDDLDREWPSIVEVAEPRDVEPC
jgi:hypothetical protein